MIANKQPSQYYVWNKKSDIPMNLHLHSTLEDAREEARHLARANPRDTFYIIRILESVRYSEEPFIYTHFSGKE